MRAHCPHPDNLFELFKVFCALYRRATSDSGLDLPFHCPGIPLDHFDNLGASDPMQTVALAWTHLHRPIPRENPLPKPRQQQRQQTHPNPLVNSLMALPPAQHRRLAPCQLPPLSNHPWEAPLGTSR